MSASSPNWPNRTEDLSREHLLFLLLQLGRQRDIGLTKLLKPFGLTLPKWRAMMVLRRFGQANMGDLARFSAVERTTLTRALDQAAASGLVVREVGDRDRRQVSLRLTAQGEAVIDEVYREMRGFNARMLAGLDPAVIAVAHDLLSAAIRNLEPPGKDSDHLINFTLDD